MKLAIFSDIHGNDIALEVMLADMDQESPDQMICLGDVATGVQPREVLARLRELAIPIVQGNHDAWLLEPEPWGQDSDFYRRICDIDLWGAAQLTDADRAFLRTFPKTVQLELGDKTVLCFHGSPYSHSDLIFAHTPAAELLPFLDDFSADIFVGGHTHQPFVRRYKDKLLLNPGSVGLPFVKVDGTQKKPPWAEYALLTVNGNRFSVELRQVAVDETAVQQAALNSGMPHAEWWIQQ